MPINPSIALSAKPFEAPDVLGAYTKMAAIQQAQNQNALAQYQLASAQREDAAQNALNAAYQRAYDPTTGRIDVNRLRQEVATGGYGSKLPALEQAYSKMETQRLEQGKMQADAIKANLQASREQVAAIDPNAPDAGARLLAWHEGNHRNPVLGPWLETLGSTAERSRGDVINAIQQGPAGIQAMINRAAMSADQLIASQKPMTVAPGASVYSPTTGESVFTAPQKTVLLSPEEEAQRIRIAQASRPPAQPPQPAAPVQVFNPVTGRAEYVTREEAIAGRMTPATQVSGLAPKDIQKHEANFPQAKQAVGTVSNTMSTIEQTVDRLLNNPQGLNGITGLIGGRTPAVTDAARRANADLEQLKNLAFVQGLTELRSASKTGAGVGNVSNREGDRFENLKASLDKTQSYEDLVAALKRMKAQAGTTRGFMQEAFDDTYAYRDGGAVPTKEAPAKPAGGGWSVVR